MACGIDLDLSSLKDKLAEMKDSALREIDSLASDARAAAQSKMDAFKSTIRGWVDELPDLPSSPGTPMLPDLLTLLLVFQDIKLHPENLGNYQVLNELRVQFMSKYGDALSKAGADLDELLEGLDLGIDPCSLVPNILTKPDGTVGEVPKDPLYAKSDSLGETPSKETDEMNTLRTKIDSNISTIITTTDITTSKMKELPDPTEIKDLISSARDITSYYEVSSKLEELDLEMALLVPSFPAVLKQNLEDTRQNV